LVSLVAGAAAFAGTGSGTGGFCTGRTPSICSSTGRTPSISSSLHQCAPPTAVKPEVEPLPLWTPPQAPQPSGPSEYQLNLGHAIDTLRVDHPRLFTHKPDLSIFAEDIEVHDPSGKRLKGLEQYERVFGMLRFLRRTVMQDAQLTHRLVVSGKEIRMRWNAKLLIRDPSLGVFTEPILATIDGVSVYELNDKGRIRKHRLENIVLRNSGSEVEATRVSLDFAWPRAGLATPELAMPFFRTLHSALPADEATDEAGQAIVQTTFAARRAPVPLASADGETPMERAAREREEIAREEARLTELRTPKKSQQAGGLGFLKNAVQMCETSYDCDAPLVCCDMLFASVCCSGGLMIPARPNPALQPQMIPIPVEKDPTPGMPEPPQYPSP